MPIYEYRCAHCGHEMEAMQKLADDPLKDCPECEQPALKKLISPVGFRLKGSGWYETDFKTGDKKKNLAESGEKSSSEKKPSDSKPEKSDSTKKTESSGKSESKSSSGGSDTSPSSSKAA
jgi:putative FmdB family regulatory protein